MNPFNRITIVAALAALALLVLANCATTTTVSSPLPCPDPLVIEKAPIPIRAHIDELKRTDAEGGNQRDRDLYEFFLRRAALQKQRRQTLQDICRSTQE